NHMKAQHRHDLETNALAKRLAVVVERVRPFIPMVVGAVVILLIGCIGFSWFSTESAARQSESWNSYNQAVEGLIPNLEQIRGSSEEGALASSGPLSNGVWADGQLGMACRDFISRRAVAMEELNRAETAYLGLLASTKHPQLVNRAHLGLGRVYELRNEL